jgi:DNA-directed RNA polymerases I, II, and III subunit RPABC1
MDQLAVPSQQSPVTMDSAESAAAAVGSALLDDDYDAVPEPPACISSMIDRGGSVESHRLFLARRTALEMLRDRGYSFPESDLALTLPEFRAWWADRPELERLAITATLASDHSNKVTFFPLSP